MSENHASAVKDSLSRNVLVDIAARVGYLLTRFFIPPFVLARVSLEAYGLWSTAFIVVAYVGLSTMGISNVYIKYVAEHTARREYDKANQLLSTGLCLTVPGCLGAFGLIYFLWPRIALWLNVPPALAGDAREVVLSVVFVFLTSLSLTAYHDAVIGAQYTSHVQYRWVICYLVETVLIFGLVGFGRGIRGLSEAFVARTVLDIGLCVVMAYRLLPWLSISPRLVTKEAFHKLWKFGGVVQILALFSTLLNSIERAVAAPLAGLAATALMDIGKKLPVMAGSVPLAFASSFVPAASYLHGGMEGSAEQQSALQKLYLKGARYMNLSSAYFCGFLVALAGPMIDAWMGKHYDGAPYLVAIFSISTQIHLMTGPGTSILKGIGRPNMEFHYAIPNALALLVAIPVSRWIAGGWTVSGIATATAISTVVSACWFVWRCNRLLHVSAAKYFRFVVLPGLAPYVVAAPFSAPANYVSSHFSRWTSFGCIGVLGLIYSILLLVVVDRMVWETGERYWFHDTLRAKLGRFFPGARVKAAGESA
jgi:O-antigen/teichoic acid export membrane protein